MFTFTLDTDAEIKNITTFLRKTLESSGKRSILIASSGGIDSSVSLALCVRAVGTEHIRVLTLPYGGLNKNGSLLSTKLIDHLNIPRENTEVIDITPSVDQIISSLQLDSQDMLRRGNIMARTRMIFLYDRAKKLDALVCGTENKSEYYLGYFTRFGDEASDIEPVRHLFKTQVYMLARALSLPPEIISQKPTAGLWESQTDEDEFGFSYEEADNVLALHFEKQIAFEDIPLSEFPHKNEIKRLVELNDFKHHVPYLLDKK